MLRIGLAVLVALSVSANAAQFRFHDYLESPDVAWLTADGTQVTGNGTIGGGTITNFSINQFYNTTGERISFDYQVAGFGSVPGVVFTRLMGASDEPGLVSDEFLLWATDTSGLFHVDFISYDSPNGVMVSEHPGLSLPTPTTFIELTEWQFVGQITTDPQGLVHDTFEVMSIPEPGTYAMILAGLGLLGAVMRRRK
jgi:hypothetical protein